MELEFVKQLKALSTDNFQGRGDAEYPQANVPDSVFVFGDTELVEVKFSFKNTSESRALRWVKNYMAQQVGAEVAELAIFETAQVGDYTDDWVDADVTFIS